MDNDDKGVEDNEDDHDGVDYDDGNKHNQSSCPILVYGCQTDEPLKSTVTIDWMVNVYEFLFVALLSMYDVMHCLQSIGIENTTILHLLLLHILFLLLLLLLVPLLLPPPQLILSYWWHIRANTDFA